MLCLPVFHTARAPNDAAMMAAIDVERVWQALQRQLAAGLAPGTPPR